MELLPEFLHTLVLSGCSHMTSVLKNSLSGGPHLGHGLLTYHTLKHVLKATFMLLLGAPHPGWDGDGWDGPGDQHERNHHTGGHSEQDGEVWGKQVSAPSPWLDSTSNLWGFVYSMQACVYAAPCMLLSSNCGCSLPTLECLCSFFFFFRPPFSRRCTALNADQDET